MGSWVAESLAPFPNTWSYRVAVGLEVAPVGATELAAKAEVRGTRPMSNGTYPNAGQEVYREDRRWARITPCERLPCPGGEAPVGAVARLGVATIVVTPSHIRSAMENEARYQTSFWDGLIVAAAEARGAEVLYTEDLNDGQRYGAKRDLSGNSVR